MNTSSPHYAKLAPHVVDTCTRKSSDYTPENAYLKLENYVDLFIEKGYCSKNELRWLKIKRKGLDCMDTITFLNRFYDESGLQFIPIDTSKGYCEFNTSNVCEYIVLNKLFLKSEILDVLNHDWQTTLK